MTEAVTGALSSFQSVKALYLIKWPNLLYALYSELKQVDEW